MTISLIGRIFFVCMRQCLIQVVKTVKSLIGYADLFFAIKTCPFCETTTKRQKPIRFDNSKCFAASLNKMDEGTKQRIRTAGYNAGKVAGKLTTDQLVLLQSFEDIKAFLDEVMKESTGKTIIILLSLQLR